MVRTVAPGLLTPITIKGRTLGNRIVMPPMASHLSPPDGSVTQEHLDRYVPWQEQLPVAADLPWRFLTRRRDLDSAGLPFGER